MEAKAVKLSVSMLTSLMKQHEGPTHDWEFREQDQYEGGKVDGEQSVIVPSIVGRDQEPAVSASIPCTIEPNTHSPMGTLVNHFLAGVYWAPASICSHNVSSS